MVLSEQAIDGVRQAARQAGAVQEPVERGKVLEAILVENGLKIELNGGGGIQGLKITAGGSTIKGLVINRFLSIRV